MNLQQDSSPASTLPSKTLAFKDLGLSPRLLRALDAANYQTPTPVQAGLIPHALEGSDVIGQARTGTGKTAAFAIPILERIDRKKRPSSPVALVLVPTRELAVQVKEEFQKLGDKSRVRIVAVYGGKPVRQQTEKLKAGVHVVVGTPGRVLDHLGRGSIDLSQLDTVVLDEADRMLDIGFRPDIEKILKRCPRDRQTLLLSATVAPPVERLAQRYMRDPEFLNFSPKEVAVESIDQCYFTVDAERKFDLLRALLKREKPSQAIIFCRTKRGTQKVYDRLSKIHDSVGCIHGDREQRQRDSVMSSFRSGKTRILVATDVVGRGIDVTGISHIINYDIPQFCDDYVHRVGRTGRMGREGIAFTFVTPEEGNELTRIEVRINRLLRRDEIDGFVTVAPVAKEMAPASVDGDKRSADVTEAQPQEAKPSPPAVTGRRTRRYRRAL